MNISDRITSLKPYIGGAVVGAVAVAVVGFSAGWVVTTGTMKNEVAKAQINVLAQICEQDAATYWTGQGNEMAALDGWRNKDRAALAEQFSAKLNADANLHKGIQDRCETLLEPA